MIQRGRRGAISRARRWLSPLPAPARLPGYLSGKLSSSRPEQSRCFLHLTRSDSTYAPGRIVCRAARSVRSRISERRAGDVDDIRHGYVARPKEFIRPSFSFLFPFSPISFRRNVKRGVNNREKCLCVLEYRNLC